MKIVKIDVSVKDYKYSNYHFVELALNLEAAMKWLNEKYPGMEDITSEEKYYHDNPPVSVFHHTKKRYEEDGSYDYPIESTIELYWEEVIE